MYATAGIIIPVAIHLWNVKQGKILKVGSIALLTLNATKNTSSLKLNELLLLLLRCLMIVLLAVLLSQPQWKTARKNGQTGWVLINKEELKQTYDHFKPQVDSLIKAGYQFHYFDTGFEKKDINDALAEQKDSTAQKTPDWWGLVRRLNNNVDTALPVYLFTSNSLNSFTGNRPVISFPLHWYTYTVPDQAAIFLTNAYATSTDSMRIVIANSTSTGTKNSYQDVSLREPGSLGYSVNATNKGLELSYKGGYPVIIDTATLHITVYADTYVNDARYLKAAIDAIRQFSKRRIILSVVNSVTQVPYKQDWLFWLSDQEIPGNITANNVFKYEHGKEQGSNSWIITGDEYSPDADQISLYKYIPVQNADGVAIWQDGFGNTLLNMGTGRVNIYHFFSHFDPSWNDLPWSNDFPKLLFKLIIHQDDPAWLSRSQDKRSIDNAQVQPRFKKVNNDAKADANVSEDLSRLFWALVFIVFFSERIIALNLKKEASNA